MTFWTKFTQKMYFQLKTEQAVQGLQAFPFCVVKLIQLLFWNILKILKISWFGAFWKKYWLCLVSWALLVLKLYSFKFLYNFTEQLKNLKLVMVMVKSFDKYHHLFNLHILVTILFFRNWDLSTLNIKIP